MNVTMMTTIAPGVEVVAEQSDARHVHHGVLRPCTDAGE